MRPTPARIAAALLVAALSLSARADDNDGFVPLVKGDDLSQFEMVAIGPKTVKVEDGEIRVSGTPNGYLASRKDYRNYVVRFDWKYERPSDLASDADFNGNSGLLVHIEGEHKVWPKCIEVQLMNKDAGNIFAINGAKCSARKDADAQKRAIKPVGEWNQEEVTCQDGAITCKINGIEVAKGTGAMPDHGPIAWQSEGKPIRFRNLRIKTLD